jgi:GDP-L-fucose synthase
MTAQQEIYRLDGRRLFLAGHNGLVGSALRRRLARETCEVITAERAALDLTRQADVEAFMGDAKPDCVVIAAARVGGILANSNYPVEFLGDNLLIITNLIRASHDCGIDRLLLLGSSCIYPKSAPQPISEDALLSGALEPTNEAYAIAKIAGLKLCAAYRKQFDRRYIAAMPTNLYGPHDRFDPEQAHVIPALMQKIHAAKRDASAQVEIWGSGAPLREFMHVDDLADALVFLLKHYDDAEHINVGTGREISIRDLAETIARVIGYDGAFIHDRSKPDGTQRKLLASTRLHGLGWTPSIDLEQGLEQVYRWYRENVRD